LEALVLTALIREEEKPDPWLHECSKMTPSAAIADAKELALIFDAYRELRIKHQLDYTNYKLQDDQRVISTMPRRQLAVISQAVFACLLLLVVMDVGVLAAGVLSARRRMRGIQCLKLLWCQ
jgi:hypothetical protein